jgi:RHS repeat-associated protein
MAVRVGPLVLVLGLLAGAALSPSAAGAVVRLTTSHESATWPVPDRGAAPAYARSYFGARYLATELGRFTTVDPVYTWTENLVDPQRWNRYAYVRNNPLRFTNPDGRCIYPGANCWQFLVGMAKAAANTVPDIIDVTNRATELVIAPVTDLRFGNFPRFQPANEDQRRGMVSACRNVRAGQSRPIDVNAWFLSSEGKIDSRDLRRHLDWLLERLAPVSEQLKALQGIPGVAMYVTCIWWAAHGEGGPTLGPRHMRGLAALDLECSFELAFYGDAE